jgi:type II secretory pathway component PulK
VKLIPRKHNSGIALAVVMIAIFVLSLLAAAFAYQMKVETKLAQNADSEMELLWLGRSGVDYCRWILAQSEACPGQQYDSLDQIWAGGSGGPCTSNSPLVDVMKTVPLGRGSFTWQMEDLERKFNINTATEDVLRQAFQLIGVDPGEAEGITSSILDWIDRDSNSHIGGKESSHYEGLNPPYFAKNRPIDDLSELLMVDGVTPDMYWGGVATNHLPASWQKEMQRGRQMNLPTFPVGLNDLFTPLSGARINVNTASAYQLMMVPGVDELMAQAIISMRQGGRDAIGPTPAGSAIFPRVEDLLVNAGMNPQQATFAARLLEKRSLTFKATITASIGSYSRTYIAILGRDRAGSRNLAVLSFYWVQPGED